MSLSFLRTAMSANTRTQVRCNSLTAAVSQSNPHSIFNLSSSNYSNTNFNNKLVQNKVAPSLVLAHSCIATVPFAIANALVDNMLSYITGNGVFITAYRNQNNKYHGEELSSPEVSTGTISLIDTAAGKLEELSVWLISTLKRRKKMMNKHKLRKRRKKMRLKSKK